jgi:DNA-binding transcriptional ArsR family regulator
LSVPRSPHLPGGRLAFERAIRYSSLPAPARHLALTIATWADVGTGMIPERFQPSISVLAEATGLSEATVKRHLRVLEADGWLVRDRPEISREHARTQYALTVPTGADGHSSEGAMPRLRESHAIAQSEPGHGSDVAKAGLTVSHKSPLNPDESPGSTSTSSSAEPVETEPPAAPEVTDGGGGGGGSDLRSLAIHIAASLDYRGKPPTRKIRAEIIDRLVIALEAGWSMDGLVVVLDLTGQTVRYAPAVYRDRLDPEVMRANAAQVTAPAAAARGGVFGDLSTAAEIEAATVDSLFFGEQPAAGPSASWQEAEARVARRMADTGARGGTDGTVAGWRALRDDLAAREPHKPYNDDPWHWPADPVEAAAIQWCGELECDPVMRMRDVEVGRGLKVSAPCEKCHPKAGR